MEKLKPYLSFEQLVAADKRTLTAEELERYQRGRAIPLTVRRRLEQDVAEMQKTVLETEKLIDTIIDFLNGEPTNGTV